VWTFIFSALGTLLLPQPEQAHAAAGVSLAVARGLVGVGLREVVDVHVLAAAALLLLLEVGKVARLVVDVHDGLVALIVEATEFLTSGSIGSLLEVAVQSGPASICLLCETELVVNSLSLLSGLCLGVEVLKGLGELGGVAVLLIGSESRLDSLVRDDVTMGEILGEDAGAGLLFLLNVVVAIFGLFGGGSLFASNLADRLRRANMNRVGSKLCVIEEKSRLSSGRLLESNGSSLSIGTRRLYADGLNLSAEAEEGLDLIFAGLGTDVLDVDSGGHVDDVCVLFAVKGMWKVQWYWVIVGERRLLAGKM
jgi:hypothetical protein